ncbi:arsenate reductase ArsC [Caulobacter sp. FWC2]|uniref:arsenate reductase ArsC n=1 Tax=Caulobacter sp. FWC2 TaxID=69664 RepID=UPI000C14D3DC|nr:arsenate reductase ArsC [Caulobacter sp. FWC2]PIB92772.1 ArsR family transcriptional regulator [Caulobacter sp. FWC2]
MTDPQRPPLNVLFLCTHNSARSVIAESIMNRVGAGRFKAYSAGSMPSGVVDPRAINLLQHLNYKTDHLRSKGWDEFAALNNPDAPELDFVFTVCDNAAGEVCPIWPGQPMSAHWGIPNPGSTEGSDAEVALAFAEAYRQLNARITLFCALPLASFDRLSLQKRLDDIGKSRAPDESAA